MLVGRLPVMGESIQYNGIRQSRQELDADRKPVRLIVSPLQQSGELRWNALRAFSRSAVGLRQFFETSSPLAEPRLT